MRPGFQHHMDVCKRVFARSRVLVILRVTISEREEMTRWYILSLTRIWIRIRMHYKVLLLSSMFSQ